MKPKYTTIRNRKQYDRYRRSFCRLFEDHMKHPTLEGKQELDELVEVLRKYEVRERLKEVLGDRAMMN